MNSLFKKPTQQQDLNIQGRFQKFNLIENPFPSYPSVNQDSSDKRINGNVYETEIRTREYSQIEKCFLKESQINPNHLRLGYIVDTSYIGRGNGKTAFLVNLQHVINQNYCLDLTDEANKCFAIYVTPEPAGRTKTFTSFVDLLFNAILRSGIIEYCLAVLRMEAISVLYPDFSFDNDQQDEAIIITKLNSEKWFVEQKFNMKAITEQIASNPYLQKMPAAFPLFSGRQSLIMTLVSKADFEQYYLDALRKGKERLDFVFSHFVQFLQASGFNGAYILVDDFERIPEFQSAREKKDFALELRSCLFDGMYTNARLGFYNFFLVLHAGVERLISDAWAGSGMESRSPISLRAEANHIVPFEKLSRDHAILLIRKYLNEYRINHTDATDLSPFNENAVSQIGELSEYNAAKILKRAYDLLEKAADIGGDVVVDENFVNEHKGVQEDVQNKNINTIETAPTIDLVKKAQT